MSNPRGERDDLARPRLRGHLTATPDPEGTGLVVVWDQLRVSRTLLRLTESEFEVVRRLDGRHTLRELQECDEVRWHLGRGSLGLLAALVQRLDDAIFLDGPRFRERLASPVRQPACIGCYEGEPSALRRQLERFFRDPAGPGLPRPHRADPRFRALLAPHVDFARGGITYAWGYRELAERTSASLFVIVGTSHYSPARFTLSRQDFATPLGTVPTDRRFVDRLVEYYGEGLFDDPVAHAPEHAIELEVVFLQYAMEGRPFRIVPLLVGPFRDFVERGRSPGQGRDVARMTTALRRAEAEAGEPVCFVISGDLAHVGPRFGDERPLDDDVLARSAIEDRRLVERAEACDPEGYFRVVADEGDARRICGLPPTFVTLAAIRPRRGRVLHYDQHVHPRRTESVSFASMVFED